MLGEGNGVKSKTLKILRVIGRPDHLVPCLVLPINTVTKHSFFLDEIEWALACSEQLGLGMPRFSYQCKAPSDVA